MEGIDKYISPCCHAFYIYDGISAKCTACLREVAKIDQPLIIGVKFNAETANTSGSALNQQRLIAKRFATDPTYEICSKECPKCKSLSRYFRDMQGKINYVCSNPKCREVFY